MSRNNARSGSLLLAGLAAFAYYKYSKMTPEERRTMFDGLKAKGKKLVDEYVPANIKDRFMKKDDTNTADHFGEGSTYTG
jgi:hypothetical protein